MGYNTKKYKKSIYDYGEGYLCSADGIYRKWAENPEKSGAAMVEELTDITARLLLNSLSDFL